MEYSFLIASERSGSNLITKLIDNHSRYCAPSPPHLLRAFYDKVDKYNDLKKDDNWQKLVIDFIELYNLKIGGWNTDFKFEELYSIKDRTLSSLIKHIYAKEADNTNKQNVFIKEVKPYKIFDFINTNFTNSKFVYLVRDPRDMALSWKKSPVHRGDLVRASKIWQEDQKHTLDLVEKYKERILVLTYEDLISNQKPELIKICNFLGISFEETMLDFHKNKLTIENSNQTDNWKNLNKNIISDNFKKYLKDLTENEIKYIEYICSDEMLALNYEKEYPKISDSEFEKLELEMLQKERYTKPEYNAIAEEEKIKRQQWMSKFNSIKNLA